jgi:hypothetical protein
MKTKKQKTIRTWPNGEFKLPGERRQFKPWTGENNNTGKPRSTEYDSAALSYGPALHSVKAQNGHWTTPDGTVYAGALSVGNQVKHVDRGSIEEQRRDLAELEAQLQSAADDGMVGFGPGDASGVSPDEQDTGKAVTMEDYELYHG